MLQLKHLASGELPTVKGALYTATATVLVRAIRVVNTNVVYRMFNLYHYNGTTEARIGPKDLDLGPGFLVEHDQPLILEAGHVLRGDAEDTGMTYTIDGSIETELLT